LRLATGGAVELVKLCEVHFAAEREIDRLDVGLESVARELHALSEPALKVRQERPGVVYRPLPNET
jgi:hypothetical protein